jgi:hypothetical protein
LVFIGLCPSPPQNATQGEKGGVASGRFRPAEFKNDVRLALGHGKMGRNAGAQPHPPWRQWSLLILLIPTGLYWIVLILLILLVSIDLLIYIGFY